jgi:hypothetical protein
MKKQCTEYEVLETEEVGGDCFHVSLAEARKLIANPPENIQHIIKVKRFSSDGDNEDGERQEEFLYEKK